jgi:DNA-binding MarR family transcriptional regulator
MEHSQSLIYLVKQIEMGLRRPFVNLVEGFGMSAAQYTALTVLLRLPGLTSSDLARRSFVRAQSMAETLTPLLEAGLVTRKKNPSHGRQMLLYISDEGARRTAEITEAVRGLEEQLTTMMNDDQIEELIHLLRLARHGLSTPTSAAGSERAEGEGPALE